MIIKEKFRVFLENLGIRGKISNILFKNCVRKIFLSYVRMSTKKRNQSFVQGFIGEVMYVKLLLHEIFVTIV